MSPKLAYIGLGANIGDPRGAVANAIERLSARPDVRLLRRAGLYQTDPVGLTDQPDFINTVVEIETPLDPGDLLSALKGIEAEMGRAKTVRWGPRVIDLDLLLYGDQRLDSASLTLPHPEMWQRLFVLAPLSELRADLRSPEGSPILELCSQLGLTQGVRRLKDNAE